jgi:hypothetical protein
MMARRVLLALSLAGAAGGGAAAVELATAIDPIAIRLSIEWVALASAVTIAWRSAVILTRDEAVEAASRSSAMASVAGERRMSIGDGEGKPYPAWYFRLRGAEEVARATRHKTPLAIVRVRGLKQTPSAQVWQALRPGDLPGDLGETIAVLLPNTDRAGAEVLASRLQVALAVDRPAIAVYGDDARTLDEFLGTQWPGEGLSNVIAAA